MASAPPYECLPDKRLQKTRVEDGGRGNPNLVIKAEGSGFTDRGQRTDVGSTEKCTNVTATKCQECSTLKK